VNFQLDVGGDWHQLAKIEMSLKQRHKALTSGFLDWRRDVFRLDDIVRLPYVFEANAMVNIALFDLLIHFLRAEKRIEIKEVWTDRYLQGKTAVPMQKIRILTYIPIEVNFPELRENYMIFCEQYNFDGMFELDRSTS
jgi:glycine cleavage system transcriptional repressor